MSPSLAPTKDEDLAAVTFVKYRTKSESEQIMVWLLQTIARFCLPDVAAQPGESDLICQTALIGSIHSSAILDWMNRIADLTSAD